MAIIICKSCGKKVSDTVDVCIHCGKNPLQDIEEVELQSLEQEVLEEKTVDFNELSEAERLKLEGEFLKEDEWSKKYMRSHLEAFPFMRPLLVYPALLFLILRLLFSFTDIFVGSEIENEGAFISAIACGIGLVAVCVVMFVYSIIRRIYNRAIHARYIYYRRLQKWLQEKKNISFFPELRTLSQKAFFESIVIE